MLGISLALGGSGQGLRRWGGFKEVFSGEEGPMSESLEIRGLTWGTYPWLDRPQDRQG